MIPRKPELPYRGALVVLTACLVLLAPLAGAEPEGLELLEVVRMTLERDPNVALAESRVELSRGVLVTETGRFDPVMSTEVNRSAEESPQLGGSTLELETLSTGVGVTKEFRTGLSVIPQLDLTRSDEPGAQAVNLATVSFTLRQPLLRDRGRSVVAAGERSAERQLEADDLDLRHTIAQRVQVVADQYWQVEAARQNLEIFRTSEERSRQLLETTRRLIEADVTPAAELIQLRADLASKESVRIRGERDLFEALQALGREIGLPPAEIRRLGLPANPFPELAAAEVPSPSTEPFYIRRALELRADLAASRERLEASSILRHAAANAVEPRLDLLVTPSYTGRVVGGGGGSFFSPLLDNVPGLSTSVGLSLSWPTFNRSAEGALIQAQAVEEQSSLQVDLDATRIGADVPAALDAVRKSALELDKAIEAERFFAQAVDNEEKKLRAGTSTIIDVITQQDRLTSARQSVVAARLALARSILDLRFQTGSLLGQGGEGGAIQYRHLTTLPFADQALRADAGALHRQEEAP